MVMPVTEMGRPVRDTLGKSPLWVPETVQRVAVVSPSVT